MDIYRKLVMNSRDSH